MIYFAKKQLLFGISMAVRVPQQCWKFVLLSTDSICEISKESFQSFKGVVDSLITTTDTCLYYNQTCVKRPYKTRHVFDFSDRWLLIAA